ncbi:YicC/YloC family endoribonuclease [Chrysiogenes arsenatis]|uniref:YicC/YloC family endoribonuclease n=1 Tax=Chrysiogenes arsenatis TaxID=309797 RepID=UPI0003FD9242|nr:YicC/YloC family endoribonuclease [Chrysiogenes arsenatis]
MIRSMTGFGSGSCANESLDVTMEIRAVNSRYFDFNLRSRSQLGEVEVMIKNYLNRYIARGKVDVTLRINFLDAADHAVQLNRPLADEYYKVFTEIVDRYNLERVVTLDHFLQTGKLVDVEETLPNQKLFQEAVEFAMKNAVTKLLRMRQEEGERLEADILARLDVCEMKVLEIEKIAAEVPLLLYEKLQQRIAKLASRLSDELQVDPERIAQEVALLADKADITEEVIRFGSHVRQFRDTTARKEPVGRALEFLLQEMHREVNTMASKTSDGRISRLVVDVKAELEKIKEQVQNIE